MPRAQWLHGLGPSWARLAPATGTEQALTLGDGTGRASARPLTILQTKPRLFSKLSQPSASHGVHSRHLLMGETGVSPGWALPSSHHSKDKGWPGGDRATTPLTRCLNHSWLFFFFFLANFKLRDLQKAGSLPQKFLTESCASPRVDGREVLILTLSPGSAVPCRHLCPRPHESPVGVPAPCPWCWQSPLPAGGHAER